MKELTFEGVIWAVLTTVFQLGLIIAVKICGYLFIGFLVKRFNKHKEEEKKKELLEIGEELNYDYESEWEEVEESITSTADADADFGSGDNAGQPKEKDASMPDDFITETDKLLASIRRRRMEDDLANESVLLGKKKSNTAPSNEKLTLREMMQKYKPKY